jgi:hypothetical protein
MVRKKVLDLPDEVRAYFAAASARRVKVERSCVVCGADLGLVIRKRLYCGATCAKRANRAHRRATPPAGGPDA